MQMILNDESKHSYQTRALLFGWLSLPSYTNLPGWLQAAGKGWLGIRNKKTLQPYESGKINPYIFTFQVFLEDHKIWRNLPSWFSVYQVNFKSSGILFRQSLVAFIKNLKFIR